MVLNDQVVGPTILIALFERATEHNSVRADEIARL